MTRPFHLAILLASMGTGLAITRAASATGNPPESPGPKPSYVLVVTGAKRVHDALTFDFFGPKLRATDWDVFIPQLPELAGQTAVRSTLLPGGKRGHDASALGRPLLLARVPVQGAKWRDILTVRVEYEATLLERHLEPRKADASAPAAVVPPGPKERKLALAGGHQLDFSAAAFQGWLDKESLRRAPEEGEIDFARRAFVAIKGGFQLAATPETLVSRICLAGKTDKLGLAIVFVSALRASGIPARVLCGRWALPSVPGARAAEEPHVKAEFFAEGVGWVPVDVVSAVLRAKTGDGLKYFGNDEADFLTLHLDTDVELETSHFGRKTMPWLPSAQFWAFGSGSLDGASAPVLSKITVEPVDPSAPLRKPGSPAGRSAKAARRPERTPAAAEKKPEKRDQNGRDGDRPGAP